MGGNSRPAMGIIPPEMTRSCPPAFGIDLDDVEDVLQKEEYWGKKRGENAWHLVNDRRYIVFNPSVMLRLVPFRQQARSLD